MNDITALIELALLPSDQASRVLPNLKTVDFSDNVRNESCGIENLHSSRQQWIAQETRKLQKGTGELRGSSLVSIQHKTETVDLNANASKDSDRLTVTGAPTSNPA